MKRLVLSVAAVLSAMIVFTGCGKENPPEWFVTIDGLTIDNYPKVDGSTSTAPLNALIACKLLGMSHSWMQSVHTGTWEIIPGFGDDMVRTKFWERVTSSQTHQSLVNLIDGEADLVLSARKMSPDEKEYADAAGITLIETPIALDAFIFIVNPANKIKSLTTKQIQDIYTGSLTNWKEVGGNDVEINPYVRNPNSGSQELMDLLVMKDLEYFTEYPISDEVVIFTMWGAFEQVNKDASALCYTVFYYKDSIVRKDGFIKGIAVDGVYPDRRTIAARSYPYTAEVYASIRSDLDPSSMAHKIYELLQTDDGKRIIAESGYVPY